MDKSQLQRKVLNEKEADSIDGIESNEYSYNQSISNDATTIAKLQNILNDSDFVVNDKIEDKALQSISNAVDSTQTVKFLFFYYFLFLFTIFCSNLFKKIVIYYCLQHTFIFSLANIVAKSKTK